MSTVIRYFSFIFLFFCFQLSTVMAMPIIIDKPIQFDAKRIALTKAYIKKHYGLTPKTIEIIPRMIIVHWTEDNQFKSAFKAFYSSQLRGRQDISDASALNVSAQFIVDRDGAIYRLMPENWMARHTIGLNYVSIGIENVGGKHRIDNLTAAQLQANIVLIRYLKQKYPTITTVAGHKDYRKFENHPYWLEKDNSYRTQKVDPGERFMRALRQARI